MQKNNLINCAGDACVGDQVIFEKAIFEGTYPKSKFVGTEKIAGTIIKDSYGKEKQQHTFTIKLGNGNTLRIKGRNLYRNGCERKIWDNEQTRKMIIADKHERGEIARKKAEIRKAKRNGGTVYDGGYDNDGGCMYCGNCNGHYAGCAGIIHY